MHSKKRLGAAAAAAFLLVQQQRFLLAAAFGGDVLPTAQQLRQSIKLMTYNIHAWRDAEHKCNFDRIVRVVQQVHPDILFLNEVLHPFARPHSTEECSPAVIEQYYQLVKEGKGRDNPIDSIFLPCDENLTFLHRLAEETNLPNIEFNGATDNSFFGKGTFFGNAILTSLPIVDWVHVPLEVEEGDLELGNQKRDFVDPRAFSAAKVLVDVADNNLQQKQLNIGMTFGHLDHKSEELREKQILRGIQKTQSLLESVSHIVCGDFNTFQRSDCTDPGWQAILDLYQSRGWPLPCERSLVLDALVDMGYKDTFYDALGEGKEESLKKPLPTSWTNRPLMRIDHIFAKHIPGGIQIVPKWHYRVETDASDHFPVVLEADLAV